MANDVKLRLSPEVVGKALALIVEARMGEPGITDPDDLPLITTSKKGRNGKMLEARLLTEAKDKDGNLDLEAVYKLFNDGNFRKQFSASYRVDYAAHRVFRALAHFAKEEYEREGRPAELEKLARFSKERETEIIGLETEINTGSICGGQEIAGDVRYLTAMRDKNRENKIMLYGHDAIRVKTAKAELFRAARKFSEIPDDQISLITEPLRAEGLGFMANQILTVSAAIRNIHERKNPSGFMQELAFYFREPPKHPDIKDKDLHKRFYDASNLFREILRKTGVTDAFAKISNDLTLLHGLRAEFARDNSKKVQI